MANEAVEAYLSKARIEEATPDSWAREFLQRMGPDDIPILGSALRDENPKVRGAAAFGLGHFGDRSRTHIPILIKMTQSSEPSDRFYSPPALARISPEDDRVIAVQLKELTSKSLIARSLAARALGMVTDERKREEIVDPRPPSS